MPLVLAIEPDLRQAAIVKRIVREKVLADVAVVDSRDAALEAIRLADAGRAPDQRAAVAARRGRADRAPAHARQRRPPADPHDPAARLGARTRRGARVGRAAVGVPQKEEEGTGGRAVGVRSRHVRGGDPLLPAARRGKEARAPRRTGAGRVPRITSGVPRSRRRPPRPSWIRSPAESAPSSSSSWASPFEWKPSSASRGESRIPDR